MKHTIPAPVLAIPVFAVFSGYDGLAPDTENYFFVASEDLANEACGILNQNPRAYYALGCVDGYEWAKSIKYRPAFVAVGEESKIFTSIEDLEASEYFEKDEDEDEDSDE